MGRLTKYDMTISEAIEHLKGAGFQDSAFAPFYPFYEDGSDYKDAVDVLMEAVKELQRYKDLEEAGRLIELPCAVGDTVWEIVLLPMLPEDGMREHYVIWEREFRLEDVEDTDKTVFLTKEEAEAKLKELEGVKK